VERLLLMAVSDTQGIVHFRFCGNSEGKRSSCNNEVKPKLHQWMQTLSHNFFLKGIKLAEFRWDKRLYYSGEYVEKWRGFP
jgi:hypothetical protein